MHLPLLVAATVYGLAAGSLLARPGYRLSVAPAQPWRVCCPSGHPLPGVGGLSGWLGPARCRRCPAPGSYGLPAAWYAVLTAVCCGAVAGAVGGRPELVVWLLLTPVVVLLTLVDRAVQRLPDVLTLPLAGASAAGLGAAALLPGAGGSWPRALLAGLVLGGAYFLLFLINPNGMGFGDVKLAVSLGVALGWYGWDFVVFGTFAGFLLAAGYGLMLVIARKAGRKTAMAFGPFMALGAFSAILLGGLAG